MNARLKPLMVLRMHVRTLPASIVKFERLKRPDDAARCRRMLVDARSEIERRESLAVRQKMER